MDQQLKQRLIGVTIVVALVVIFVPMLFEKSDDKGKLSTLGIPDIPEDVMEKPLELPKTAEDLAPKDKEAEKAPAETGYKVVPLNDEPPPPKPSATQAAKAEEGGEPTAPVEDLDEAETPSADTPPAEAAKPSAAKQPAPDAVKRLAEPKQAAAPKAPKPPPAAKPQDAADEPAAEKPQAKPKAASGQPPAHAADAAAKKSAGLAHPTVKVNKPKPAAKPAPTDDADDSAPAAAKDDDTQPAKPAAKPDKPKAKPADKPQAKAPGAWVVQTGSFTEEGSARGLVEKLKQSKLPAYVETVQGAHGPIYRVQVGPEPSRGRAEETLKQIGGNFGINGFISPRH